MPADEWTLFPGRFQPFHLGHEAVVAEVLAIRKRIVICVIANSMAGDPRNPWALSREGDEHHLPERNPFTVVDRVWMLTSMYYQKILSRRIVVTGIPRPELAWEVIPTMFPGHREWIVPQSSEEFDNAKAAFFAERADAVLRVKEPPGASGREVRAALVSGAEWAAMVPPSIASCIRAIQTHG